MKTLLSAKQVEQALDVLYQDLVRNLPQEGTVAIVGILTRGQTIAQRIVERLQAEGSSLNILTGVLDITFYRDDLSGRKGAPIVRATQINFDVDDMDVLLVDDVLATGRSVRAALDALHDFGRPKAVRLAVLIDRGGREMPISADFVGKKLKVAEDSRIQVKLKESDGEEGVFITQGE